MDYDATGEVRFAVVLYGGVSLAIYMNGITQELYELVRATAPAENGEDLHLPDDALRGAGRVYRRLGRLLDQGSLRGSENGPVRTRFVVDIITGTSAGGINGVFLAKALANDQEISPLSDLWIKEGDIGKLLNDRGVSQDAPAVRPQRPPLSLLSGERMLYQLLRAIDHVSQSRRPAASSPYADAIDLWVTTTDLEGRPETINTARQKTLGVVREANHRTTFHFLYDSRAGLNLFGRGYDPMLAFAARCTSSFPGAFQAVQLCDLDLLMTGVENEGALPESEVPGAPGWHALDSSEVGDFFRGYGDDYSVTRTVSFADGGYLNNQPVDLVMSTLPKRRADLPVARRVLIVDPDPGGEPASIGDTPRARTELLATIVKAGTLPRIQTIGGDVDRILALREPSEVRRRIYGALDARPLTAARGAATTTPTSIAYLALRGMRTARDVGEALARVAFPDKKYEPDSEEHRLATRMVDAWVRVTDVAFLDRFDLSYWLRCINFLQAQAGHEMCDPGVDSNRFNQQRTVRRALDVVFADLAKRAREIRFRGPRPDPSTAALRPMLGAMDVASQADSLEADLAVGTPLRTALDAVLARFSDRLELDIAAARVQTALGDNTELNDKFERFPDYDEATLALSELIPGENDDIEVVRVSPRDTRNIVNETTTGSKLAGTQVHHFGGFFSADWRRNDILWGRLDAAERFISALWPEGAPELDRRELVTEAQLAILEEALQDDGYRTLLGGLVVHGLGAQPTDPDTRAGEAKRVFDGLRHNYQPPPRPDPRESLVLGARAARVADAVGTGLVRHPGPFAAPGKWLGRVLRLGANLVELALPDRMRSIVGRHLLDVTVLAAILAIVLGGVVGGPGVVGFGWSVLFLVLGAKLVIEVLRSWFERKFLVLLVTSLAAAVIGLAVYGVVSWHDWQRTVALILLGVALGLLLAAGVNVKKGKKPVLAGALALLIVLGVGMASAGHGRNELAKWSCDRHGWYRAPLTRVLLAPCAATKKVA